MKDKSDHQIFRRYPPTISMRKRTGRRRETTRKRVVGSIRDSPLMSGTAM
jgi:hypothetical protein